MQAEKPHEYFILEIISAVDIPLIDKNTKSDPYIQAYMSSVIEKKDGVNRSIFQLQKVGSTVRTPYKTECSAAVWNCYRDLHATPMAESVLTVELYHHHKDTHNHKVDNILGKVDIPITVFVEEEAISFPFINFKVRSDQHL